jgi:molybdate transport system substrate-binding protein
MIRLTTLVLGLGCLVPLSAVAAQISVLSAGAVQVPLSALAQTYQRRTGDRIEVKFNTMGALQQKVAAGERADIVIATEEGMEQLAKQGHIVPGSRVPLGEVGIGVAVRENAPLPDISTTEAFKQTLLKAKSIVYVDPTKGTSGKHLAGVLERLGIAEAVRQKTVLVEGGYALEPVAKGEVEIGMQQISEILAVKGVTLVGPLPPDLQKITTYSAAIMSGATSQEAAAAFIHHMASSEGRATFAAKGFAVPR